MNNFELLKVKVLESPELNYLFKVVDKHIQDELKKGDLLDIHHIKIPFELIDEFMEWKNKFNSSSYYYLPIHTTLVCSQSGIVLLSYANFL